ncbi:MAG: glycoside hydrolase family 3 C-terminal domain-containing protein, partial [Bacteroidota bacterium]
SSDTNGVATFMNAFNDIDGTPATANPFLLREILKGKWNYDGMVVSDWGSIMELIVHGVAENGKEAAYLALSAGSDMDMEGDIYIGELEELINEGRLDESLLDDAVARVLRLKYKLGLFDDPYKYCDTVREINTLLNEENLKASREVAKKSMVLLKNKDNLLPLKNPKSIALIGPLVKDKDAPLANWRAQAVSNSAVSLYEGLTTAFGPDVNIKYAEGCKLSIGENSFAREVTIEENDRSGFPAAIAAARSAEVVIMALGEPAYMSGEARSKADIGLPGLQLELLKEVYKVNKNVILILMNGRPLTINWEVENIPAILEAWHLGSEAGNAIADVVMGKYNPSGKLPMTFPRSVGQIPIYYGHKSSGRPESSGGMIFYTHYMDEERTPLFPFGFGLSYTTFEYSDISLDKTSMTDTQTLSVSVDVTNTGDVKGEEVVQLYIRDMTASVTRPIKELKGFEKIEITPGETKTVTFELNNDHLSFYKADLSFGSEPGKFKVFVGTNSQELKEADFELK